MHNDIPIAVALAGMAAFAFAAVQTVKLRRAVVYLAAFSMLSSFVYLSYAAPDVAIAEAAIGCTLATVLYLIALKKYRVYTIYCLGEQNGQAASRDQGAREDLMRRLEVFLAQHEFEPQIIHRSIHIEDVGELEHYDLIVERTEESHYFCCHPDSKHQDIIRQFLEEEDKRSNDVEMISMRGDEPDEGL